MLFTSKSVEGLTIHAKDGKMGELEDLFFDDGCWCVRYLVVDTRKWLPGGLVLVSPHAFDAVDWQEPSIRVDLTEEQIRTCPDMDAELPISRAAERGYREFFGWPLYWGPYSAQGAAIQPTLGGFNRPATPIDPSRGDRMALREEDNDADAHLYSVNDLKTYALNVADERVGSVKDVVIEEETLNLRYLVVDTGGFLSGRTFLLPVLLTYAPAWESRTVPAKPGKDLIESAPEYTPGEPITDEYLERLNAHFETAGAV
jgi:hypothetical protein